MNKLFRLLTVTALASLMLVGCAGKSAETVKQSGAETPKTIEKKEYTYKDVAGRETVFKEAPKKVAISYLPHWETLVMLDVMPIATVSAKHYAATWDPFKGRDFSSIADLGTNSTTINLELLAQLEPDVILHQVSDPTKLNIENLEKIAPVVVFGEQVKMDWRFALRELGAAVGKSQKAEEVITDINKKLADSKVKLQKDYKDKTVMLMSLMGKDRYFIAYRPDLFDKEKGLGLNSPQGYPTSESYTQISMESIVKMNPDYIFVSSFDGDEALFEELSNNSVWKSLNAVKAGHVYTLDGAGHAASVMSTVHTVDFMIDKLLSNK